MNRGKQSHPKLTLVLLVASLAVLQPFTAAAQTSDQTIATVNQTEISRQDLEREMR